MRVLLLNPPADRPMIREGRCQAAADMRQGPVPQLTLAYLATQMRRRGAQARLVDAVAENLSVEGLLAALGEWRPDVVFANTTTPTIVGDLKVLARLKEAFPGLVTAVFGAHATGAHEALAREEAVDAVIRGEPEITAAEIVSRLSERGGLRGVAGVTHRAGGACVVEPERPFSVSLDELGWPARELLPNRAYVHPLSGKPYTTVHISRGCPHRCVFCVAPLYYGRPIRQRTAEDVLDELERDVLGRHGIDHVWFYADDLTAEPEVLRRVCEGILRRGLKLRWWGNTRADVQDQGLFDLMARSGCAMLSIGGESGDPEMLARARKSLTLSDLPRTVRMLRRSGITSLTYFIVGLPGETPESIRRTIDFAKAAAPDFAEFYPAVPYPGTEFGELARALGLVADADLDHYETGGTRSVVALPGLTARRLDEEIQRGYREFYGRVGFLVNALRVPRSVAEGARLAGFGLGYLKRLLRPAA